MQPKTRKEWHTVKGQKQTNCNITSIKSKCQSLSVLWTEQMIRDIIDRHLNYQTHCLYRKTQVRWKMCGSIFIVIRYSINMIMLKKWSNRILAGVEKSKWYVIVESSKRKKQYVRDHSMG